jgi:hypothetical protein
MNKINNNIVIVAKTFTPLYDELEDRLRLVVNYDDIKNRVDFMITRSFILNLVPSIDEFILKHYPNDLIIEDNITIQAKSETAKSENVSKTDNVNLELLKTDEELLIKVDMSYDQNSKNTLLVLYSKRYSAKALIDGDMFQQVLKVLKSSIPYFKWGISQNF